MGFFVRLGLVILLVTLGALAAKPEYVLIRDCMISIELSDRAECKGPDMDHMVCTGVLITKKKNCEMLSAK